MRITLKVGIIAAFAWILIKLAFFYFGWSPNSMVPTVMLNILFLLIAISVGLFLQKLRDTEDTNALLDMKNGLSAGFPYVVIVSVFIYFYYSKINPEYYAHQVAENELAIEKMVNDPVQLKKFQRENSDAEVMTKYEIEFRLKENVRRGGTASFTATLATLSLLVLATLYSILVTIILRKIVFQKTKSQTIVD